MTDLLARSRAARARADALLASRRVSRARRLPMGPTEPARPWSACEAAPRPCELAAACRYGLPNGACAIDLANGGPMTLAEVADVLGLCPERVRQIEAQAVAALDARLRAAGVDLEDIAEPAPLWDAIGDGDADAA